MEDSMGCRPYRAALALAALALFASTAAANGEDLKIDKIFFIGRGFAVDPANPLGLLEVKLAVAQVTLLDVEQGIGVLELEGAKYRLSGVTVTDGTTSAVLSGPAGETGSLKCTRVSKKELDIGVCTLTVGEKTYTAYLLEAKRKFKVEERPPDVKDYCAKNPEDARCRHHYRDFCKENPNAPECSREGWPQECLDCAKACEEKCRNAPNQEECFFGCKPECRTCKEKMDSRVREAGQARQVVTVEKPSVTSDELHECARCQQEVGREFEERLREGKRKCETLKEEGQTKCLRDLEATAQDYRRSLEEKCEHVCRPVRPPGFEENACQRGQVTCKQACLERVGEPRDKESSEKFGACIRECTNSVPECPKIVPPAPQQDFCQECSLRCQPPKEDPRACIAKHVTKCQSYCNEVAAQDAPKGLLCNSQCEPRARAVCGGVACPELPPERYEQMKRECSERGGNFIADRDSRGCASPRCEGRQEACAEPYKCIPVSQKEEAYRRGCAPVQLHCPQPGAGPQPATTAAAPSQEFNQCFKCPEQVGECPPAPAPNAEEERKCQAGGGKYAPLYRERCVYGYQCITEQSCVCTQEYAPVCGKDGKTYPNRCHAGCARVEIAYEGECRVASPTPACTASGQQCTTAAPCCSGVCKADGFCQ